MVKKFIGAALLLAAIAAAAYTYLFRVDRYPATSHFSIDWAKARELAGNDGPVEIRSEKVADGEFFAWMQVAGGGWNRVPMEFRTYQLVYGDGHAIIIDAVHPLARHRETPLMSGYSEIAFAHQQQAIREADHIVVTHEHFDHIGGLLPLMAEPESVAKMYIPAAQRNSAEIQRVGFDAAQLGRLPQVDYQGMHRLAAGVVLIAAPGHAEGNQVIYVRLGDGNEYAFIGDIAWNGRNYREHHAKSIIMNLVARENAAQLNEQIAYFAELIPKSAMHFVVAHDAAWNRELIDRGLIREGLLLRAPAAPVAGLQP